MCLQASIPTPAEWHGILFPTKGVHAFGVRSCPSPFYDPANLSSGCEEPNCPPHLPPHGVQLESGKFQSYQFISLAEPRLGLHVC